MKEVWQWEVQKETVPDVPAVRKGRNGTDTLSEIRGKTKDTGNV